MVHIDIKVNNLTKRFGGNKVLERVNLEFLKGKINCIMGPSGCGKTTLLNIMMGLIKADEGTIDGLANRKIVSVFQEERLCEGFSSIANVKLVCDKKISEKEIRIHLSEVGLEDMQNIAVLKLSGGMRRRVSIVRAIMADSNVIIMDEPLKGLDEDTKIRVIDYIKDRTVDKTIIITTHSIEEVDMLKATLIEM